MRTPLVVVLAGPNGAGKSTGAAHLLRGALAVEEFNADTIAQGLSAYRPDAAAVAAGRVMLDRLRLLARGRRDFAFETTLAGRGHARWLQALRRSGYRAHLIFLSLPSADLAVARVAERVRQEGHPDAVDTWPLYDNADLTSPRLVASGAAGAAAAVVDWHRWNELKALS
jgi:predicted ABC-type ATPase